jgi:pyrroloquinoline quinone biosynthesis protein D
MLDAIAFAYDFPLTRNKKIMLDPLYKLRYEKSQEAYVLLYPEGMITLNEPSSEILLLCDGTKNQDDIICILETKFQGADLKQDVIDFIEDAKTKGWISER